MKLLRYEKQGNNVFVAFLQDNILKSATVADGGRTKEEILQDAYILAKDQVGEQVLMEDITLPEPVLKRIKIDFTMLTGIALDQYGDEIEQEIIFEIEGTDKAKIEDGQLIEDTVENDVSYFIVAKAGDLEERQERTIYAPVVSQPSEADILREELALTNQTLAELMLMIPMMQEMPPLEDIPVDGEVVETPTTGDTTTNEPTEDATTEPTTDEPTMEGGDI